MSDQREQIFDLLINKFYILPKFIEITLYKNLNNFSQFSSVHNNVVCILCSNLECCDTF